jgi:hypothetical protein
LGIPAVRVSGLAGHQGVAAAHPVDLAVDDRALDLHIVWGLSRIGLRHDNQWPLLAWLAAAVVMAPLAFLTGPRLLAVDRGKGLVTRAGSALPLIRNVTVFALQYGVAVMAALQLDGDAAVSIVGRAVSGATAGYFLGWAVALLRSYWSAGENSANV